jgi:hypothetical protein
MFHIVYDFANSKGDLSFLKVPAIIFSIGLALLLGTLRNRGRASVFHNQRKGVLVFGSIGFTLGLTLLIVVSIVHAYQYYQSYNAYHNHKYLTVTGNVTNYGAKEYNGIHEEGFDVEGVHFGFDDHEFSNYGYNVVAAKGGVIKPDLMVKIDYYQGKGKYRNVIIRLQTE